MYTENIIQFMQREIVGIIQIQIIKRSSPTIRTV